MFGPSRNRLETLYSSGVSVFPPGARTGNKTPPIAYAYNPHIIGFEDIADTDFGDKNVGNIGNWALYASNAGVSDQRYKLKQIIFGWRNHVVVIEEGNITPDDADLVFFEMPELNIFGDESPSDGEEIYLFLCTAAGVVAIPSSVSGLYSTL